MSRLFIIFSIALWAFIGLLSSCESPVTNNYITASPSPSSNANKVSVLNSLWKVVKQDTLSGNMSRDIQSTDAIKAEIEAYNAAHIDDQWFLVEGEIPSLENAPDCCIYIVDPTTHEVLIDNAGNPFMHLGWPRKQLVENYEGWCKDAISAAGVLYIDVIPPAPTPPTADQLYAKYSLYVVDSTGAIMYEYHCDTVPDGFLPMTPVQYFDVMSRTCQGIIQSPENSNVPWRVVSGIVYTAP